MSSQHTTTRGFTYNYIHTPSAGKPTILFLHGFPSSVFHWRHQIKYFSEKGYGILAPELLGYGSSSKPLEIAAYSGKGMSTDIKSLLNSLNIQSVIGVGHDWGSYLLSRMANYYPEIFTKLVFLDIGYSAPGMGLTRKNVEMINGMVKGAVGYEVFGYFLFFDEEGAAELLDRNIDSVETLFHTRDTEIIKMYLGASGGMRRWCEEGMTAPVAGYLTAVDQADFRKQFAVSNGGFAPSLNWYRAQLHDINAEDDKGIPEENHKLRQPTLLVSSKGNPISMAADFPNAMKPNVPNLEAREIEAGHWMQLEKPDETNDMLEKFFEW